MESDLSRNIKALREFNNMSQKEVAKQVHVTREMVAAWELGRSKPDGQQIKKLAKLFGISSEDLQPPHPNIPEQYDLPELAQNIIKAGKLFCDKLSERLRTSAFNPIVRKVEHITRQVQRAHEVDRWQHPLDIYAHEEYLKIIQDEILPFFPNGLVIFSEESINERGVLEPILLPKEADHTKIDVYVVVDPLDRTAEAVKAIAGFSNITVGSFTHGPLVSVVFNLFDQNVSCYYAIKGQGAAVEFHKGSSQKLIPSTVENLNGASLSAYVGRPSRLTALATHKQLLERHGIQSTFVNTSGCYGFCLVASSQIDAFFEIAKGYAWHDIISGAHILREAGGEVIDLDHNDLSDPLLGLGFSSIKSESREDYLAQLTNALSEPASERKNGDKNKIYVRRYPFIAAGTLRLGTKIATEIRLGLKS